MAQTSNERGNLLKQWIELLDYLSSTGVGRLQEEIAARFGVRERTVRKWLSNLRHADADLIEDYDPATGKKRYRLKKRNNLGWPMHSGTLQSAHLMALGLARVLFENLNGPGAETLPLEGTLAPLVKGLPEQTRSDLSALINRFHARLPQLRNTSEYGETLDDVCTAIIENSCIQFDYKPVGGKLARTRIVQPYRLTFQMGTFYLWGVICDDRGRRRKEKWGPVLFNLTRVVGETELTEFWFKPDREVLGMVLQREAEQFGPYHDQQVREYRIRIAPRATEYILPFHWHDTQEFETQSDGSVIMTMQCAGWPVVKQWLLGFGSAVTLLQPEDCVDELRDEIQQMSEKYLQV